MELLCEKLKVGYSENQILVSDISLDFNKGNIILIEGENGSGKTTILKTLSGLIPSLGGHRQHIPIEKIHYAHAEACSFLPHLRGSEIISFFEILNETSMSNELNENILFNELAKKKYQDMSSGMKQMLMLSLSLLESKEFIFWDEPLRSLSSVNKLEIVSLVKKFSYRKKIIITTHDDHFNEIGEAQRLRIFKNKLGKI